MKRKTYRMSGAVSDPTAELIPCTDGSLGYLRIEDAAGNYVGSMERRSLLALAREVLRQWEGAKP